MLYHSYNSLETTGNKGFHDVFSGSDNKGNHLPDDGQSFKIRHFRAICDDLVTSKQRITKHNTAFDEKQKVGYFPTFRYNE